MVCLLPAVIEKLRLIILRFPFEAIAIEIRQALEQFIDQVNLPEIIGATVIVDQNKFRIRNK